MHAQKSKNNHSAFCCSRFIVSFIHPPSHDGAVRPRERHFSPLSSIVPSRMNCFPCFSHKKDEEGNDHEQIPSANPIQDLPPHSPPPAVHNHIQSSPARPKAGHSKEPSSEAFPPQDGENGARTFTFRELAMATKNFRQEHLLGEGGFGKLYKGTLQTGEVVAVKRLDRIGTHEGNKDFIAEVLTLTLLKQPNLVSLMGYCADGDQRLLVYEYLPLGSLRSYIHDLPPDREHLDWQTRMKIASGAAQGLEYLHEQANPTIVYRDLKLSHILLDEDLNPKLSDYGLAKLAQGDSKSHMTPRVMGSYGYCAPEYERQGELTTKSDIYSFGVVLLEIISGRKALDTSRPSNEQNLAAWAQPFFKDPKRFPEMADPLLKNEFPERNLNQAVGIAAMCLQEEPSVRPLISDLVALLSFLAVAPPGETVAQKIAANPTPDPESEMKHKDHEGSSDSSDSDSDRESNEEHDEEQHTSNSDHESSDSSSDEDDKQYHLHQESKKMRQKSKKKGSSSGKIERNRSFSSSSSESPHPSYSAETPHGEFSTSRQNSIEESHNGSINSSYGNGRYQEYFSWSMGSSSKFKSKKGSGHMDRGSSKHMDLHRRNSRAESEGPSYSSSEYSDDE